MRRILIADDNRVKLQMIKQMVESMVGWDCSITTVTSAKEAFTLIKIAGHCFESAVIDFDFDGEAYTGADIIERLRATNTQACITCVTARAEGPSFDEARNLTLAAGADAALPFGRKDCASALSKLIR
jgi:CheY-like chemotaxis protein